LKVKAFKGNWVQIKKVVLSLSERAQNLPEDTKKVPLVMFVKGFLLNEEAEVGNEVEIETMIGRRIEGIMVAVRPDYNHTFGTPPEEMLIAGKEIRERMEGVY